MYIRPLIGDAISWPTMYVECPEKPGAVQAGKALVVVHIKNTACRLSIAE
jgi:hypothetical protein